MTTSALSVMESNPESSHCVKKPSPGLVRLGVGSILAFVYPPLSRDWLQASLFRAGLIAAANTLSGTAWFCAIIVCANLWSPRQQFRAADRSIHILPGHWLEARDVAQELFISASKDWAAADMFQRMAVVGGILFLIGAAYLVSFFVLLPFGTQPGPNRPCVKHIARTVLLGSSLVHWWGLAFCAGMLLLAPTLYAEYVQAINPLLYLFSALVLWHMSVLIHAARRDYRTSRDHPQPHDPWCDNCGYILIAADPAGRCPECGRPVAESLGAEVRPLTPWESRPSPGNFRAIRGQIVALIGHPRKLFFSMPTLTGQRAAQRWLMLSSLVIAALSSLMVPAIFLATDSEWSPVIISGSLAMGLAWAIFGLMMVGIETAGIAAFSRMRGHPGGGIYLSASSKVTSYSSILMLPWVVLGGIQLVTYVYWSMPSHLLRVTFHLSLHAEQMAVAASFAVAHIGGLLWYELTVYRGVRAIQYANK